MATVVATLRSTQEAASPAKAVEQHYGVSASGTDITMASLAGGPKRLVSVTLKYSGSASTTVTVTHNYAGLSGYDTVIASTALSSATDFAFLPTDDYYLNAGDTITVFGPLVSSKTASIVITLEAI